MISRAAILLSCLGLAACSGGGGGGGASTVVAPAVVPTNAALTSLQYSQNFSNVGVGMNGTFSPLRASSGVSVTPAAVDAVTVSYNAADQSYTIAGGGQSASFAPADKTASSNAVLSLYTKKSGSNEDDLGMFNPGAGNTSLALTYMSYGVWQHIAATTSVSLNDKIFVYGVPTAASDLPRTGTATYQTLIDGLWITSNDIKGLAGTGTLSADFAGGKTQVTLNLAGVSTFDGSVTALGGFLGAGAINSADASFSGGLASTQTSSAGYSGTYAGRFFGPAAVEAGAVFSLTNNSGAAVNGVIVGHR